MDLYKGKITFFALHLVPVNHAQPFIRFISSLTTLLIHLQVTLHDNSPKSLSLDLLRTQHLVTQPDLHPPPIQPWPQTSCHPQT